MTLVVHLSRHDGHRLSYQEVFVRLLSGSPSNGSIFRENFVPLINARDLLFATLDDDYFGFFVVSFIRFIIRRPTKGIFLRPMQCFRSERPIFSSIKRLAFSLMRHMPRIRIYTIIPHSIRPELRAVSTDWVHDPQLWDLWIDGAPTLPKTELSRRVLEMRGSKEVVIYIGEANERKGYPDFVKMAEQKSSVSFFVSAGIVTNKFADYADKLRELGMIVEDRYVSDDEILSLYAVADKAWCCYPRENEMASGVFGRAIQTGVEPIISEKSIVSDIAADIMRIGYNKIYQSTKSDLERPYSKNLPLRVLMENMKQHFILALS